MVTFEAIKDICKHKIVATHEQRWNNNDFTQFYIPVCTATKCLCESAMCPVIQESKCKNEVL